MYRYSLLILLFLSSCSSEPKDPKYINWGQYYATRMAIIDGQSSKEIDDLNHKSWEYLVDNAEIVEVAIPNKETDLIKRYMQNDLRWGAAIVGGQWPASKTHVHIYLYKYLAQELTDQLQNR